MVDDDKFFKYLEEQSLEDRLSHSEERLSDENACRLELMRTEVKQQQETLEGAKQDRAQRKQFAFGIFGLLIGYLLVVMTLLFLVASGLFSLSDTVLVTLLATTTANVIAIFVIVVRYLFK